MTRTCRNESKLAVGQNFLQITQMSVKNEIIEKLQNIVRLRSQNFCRFPNRLRTFPLRELISTVLLSPAIALHPFALVEELQIRYYLLKRYRGTFGVYPRLNPPVSFNERILHRQIYDRDPRLRIVSDKLAMRGLLEERVGKEWVVPLLGVWERPREIAWCILPEKFVLKPNHSSGSFAIVDRSVGVNIEALTAEAEEWLSDDFFERSLEWGYRGIPRRVLAEPFLYSPNGDAASEVQVYTFSGKAALINILMGTKHSSERRGCWFDVTGRRVAVNRGMPYAELQLSDRDRQRMVEIAEQVSQGFSSLRVDFFMAINGLKIGELTPYTYAGLAPWDPPELDEKLGQLWNPNCDLSIIPDYK
jgi:hypothetical protein